MPQILHVDPAQQPVFRELGLDAETIFDHELIKPWRTLSDRENCILDTALVDGRRVRWHVKRYVRDDASAEVAGHRLLVSHDIPTAPLIAWGTLENRRSFVIFDDLHEHDACDKRISSGMPFAMLLEPTADLSAKLHDAGLHHRDLYLCHFFARAAAPLDLRLIDTARVHALPRWLSKRWVVKDLAQFWYSTLALPVTDEQRTSWLDRYAQRRGVPAAALARRIERKVRQIARHDRQLRAREPKRNISIPRGTM